MTPLKVRSAPGLDVTDPTAFFTNAANRMLQSQMGLSLNRIQLYPTNQYTPSVHRLLQVAANLYDAATNRTITDYPFVPSVFRPRFTNDGGAIFIQGYAEETNTSLLNVAMRDLSNSLDRGSLQATDMVYGVPILIGAKKGYPAFNEVGLQNDVTTFRRLSFHRSAPGMPLSTNQSYTLSISNVLAIEAWNSYLTSFLRPLTLMVAADVIMSMTNESGTVVTGPDGLPFFYHIINGKPHKYSGGCLERLWNRVCACWQFVHCPATQHKYFAAKFSFYLERWRFCHERF